MAVLDSEAENQLRRLFQVAERGPVDREPNEPFHESLFAAGEGVVFRGEALELYNRLRETLARSALESGGPSPRAVGSLITISCWKALSGNPEDALRSLEEKLSSAPTEWVVATPLHGVVQGSGFRLGRCDVLPALPTNLVSSDPGKWEQEDFSGPVLVTTVQAVDQPSALVLAREDFSVAEAALAMLDERPRPTNLPTILLSADDMRTLSSGDKPTWITTKGTLPSGSLFSGFQSLSDASAKPAASRTEWEQRSLSALRWFSRSLESEWPSEILVTCLTALECLFIGNQKRGKGQRIASAATACAVLRGMTERQQRKWLEGLYKRRNGAVHEGLMYSDELDVFKLRTLTGYLCRWGVSHLWPDHTLPPRVCKTQADALGDHTVNESHRSA